MSDIRLTRPRHDKLWPWVGGLAVLALLLWASAYILGDATDPGTDNEVGADAGFGAVRAPVIPAEATPFTSLSSPGTRDLGRLIHLSGTAASIVRSNAVWIQAPRGRRILVRFEPPPPPERLRGIGPGTHIDFDGYLSRISPIEFQVWMDTLGVTIPRPPPGRKFGDLPDPAFARIDSLFVKNFYVSVRPEALVPKNAREASSAGGTR